LKTACCRASWRRAAGSWSCTKAAASDSTADGLG
jgi:hypothetical protein